jgi:hypothetical protein
VCRNLGDESLGREARKKLKGRNMSNAPQVSLTRVRSGPGPGIPPKVSTFRKQGSSGWPSFLTLISCPPHLRACQPGTHSALSSEGTRKPGHTPGGFARTCNFELCRHLLFLNHLHIHIDPLPPFSTSAGLAHLHISPTASARQPIQFHHSAGQSTHVVTSACPLSSLTLLALLWFSTACSCLLGCGTFAHQD